MHTQHLERVRALFDHWAEGGYGEAMERDYGPVAKQMLDRLQMRPRYRLLDIGCGNGYLVRWAAELGALAFGIDGSPRMIERAKHASTKHPTAEFRRAFFPAHFLKPKSYDIVVAMESMYYMPDLTTALKSARDLLVPGGTFACVNTFYGENQASHNWPQQCGVAMTLLSQAQWYQALTDAGLVVMAQERVFNGPGAGTLLMLGRRPA
jgi:2-polyprenyl-3-methyl-5-hydroxy-6-metoxy-1,4-benzoquinol methylase